MKQGILWLFISCCLFNTFSARGQKDSIYLSSEEYYNAGIEFHNDGEYAKAIESYMKISKCDPDYPLTCYEMALTYYFMNAYDEALSKCREALFLNYDEAIVYSLMGSILDETGKSEEGIRVLSEALKQWPYNQNLLYNLGVCYLNINQPEKAESVLLKSVICNPYHMRTHLGLAKANYMMGRTAQSYLAYNMVLLLNPTINNISAFEDAITGKEKLAPKGYLYAYPANFNSQKWDYLKELLESELAFKDEFDYNYNVSYMVARQSLMLFRKMQFDPSDTLLYNRLYVRLFSEIYKNIGFETYLNYILKYTNDKSVSEWVTKNQKKLNEFVTWAQSYLNEGRMYGFSYQDEKELKQTYHFDDNGVLSAIGAYYINNGEGKSGKFIYLGNGGYIVQQGNYISDKAEGTWLSYWPDGQIRKRLELNKDELDGLNYSYFPNGAIETVSLYKNGIEDGQFLRYTSSGDTSLLNHYADGYAHGPGIYFDTDQGFKREFMYNNDTIVDNNNETWFNGVPRSTAFYQKGTAEGACSFFYPNSSKEKEMFFRHDTLTGKYYYYYPNNRLSYECEYGSDGQLTGKKIYYDRNGNITAEEYEYSGGKLNGQRIEYFENGKKQRVSIYKDNRIIATECYDIDQNLVYTAKETDSTIYMKSFYPDGVLNSEGSAKNNLYSGLWRFYNPLGLLTQELNYSDGLLNGKQCSYYANGQLEEEYYCKDDNAIGEYKEYYINGHLKTWGNYDSTGRAGKWLSFHENDSISDVVFYKAGRQAGRSIHYSPRGSIIYEEYFNAEGKSVRLIYYDLDGNIKSDMGYEYGAYSFKDYYPNGKLKYLKNIKDNVMDGIQEEYYPNGRMAYQADYDRNFLNGTVKRWDYEGNLTVEAPYSMNRLEGEVRRYNEDGLHYLSHYENGLEQGMTIDYYYNGKIYREMEFLDGIRHGISNYYAPDGTVMFRMRFWQEEIEGYSYLDKNGNFIPEIPVTDTTTHIKVYYQNGKIAAQMELSKGFYHGKLISYYPSGSILREATFRFDDIIEVEKNYYPGNKIREIIHYADNCRHGLFELYHENGKIFKSGNYYLDQEEGEWKMYDESGKLKVILFYRNGEIYDIKED